MTTYPLSRKTMLYGAQKAYNLTHPDLPWHKLPEDEQEAWVHDLADFVRDLLANWTPIERQIMAAHATQIRGGIMLDILKEALNREEEV